MKEIKRVGIVGMGALGLLHASLLKDHLAADDLFFIADPERFGRYGQRIVKVNGEEAGFRLVCSSHPEEADLVILAVKYNDLPFAIETMKPFVGSDTTLVSVMNGITSEETLGEVFGRERVITTIAQGMDAMFFSNELTYTKSGQLIVGVPADSGRAEKEHLARLLRFFDKTGIAYTNADNIIYRLWWKYMLNVGYNQVCMTFDIGYGKTTEPNSLARAILYGAMREVIQIAKREGVPLSDKDASDTEPLIATLDPDAIPSMAQDRRNRKRSEVEMYAGTVMKLGKKHGIPTPVNDYLYQKVKEIEAQY